MTKNKETEAADFRFSIIIFGGTDQSPVPAIFCQALGEP